MKTLFRVSYFQIIISFLLLAVLLFFLFKIPSITPVDEDEVSFISGAQVFSETNSVKARLLISEDVSKYLEADWYGPFYPVFYGTIMKVFGNDAKVFIMTNVVLLLCLLFLIWKQKCIPLQSRMSLIGFVVCSPFVIRYFYFFMPISLNVFFIGLLVLWLVKMNKSFISGNEIAFRNHLIVYIALVLLFAFFRVTFAFAIVGLFPFAKNWRNFILYAFLSFIVVGVTFIFMNNVTAPPYAKNVSTLQYLSRFEFSSFLKGFFKTTLDNLLNKFPRKLDQMRSVESGFLPVYYIIFFAPFVFSFLYFKRKNKLLLAIALICVVTNLVSIMFYYLTPRFFVRLSAPVFVAICAIVALDENLVARFKIVFAIVLLSCTALASTAMFKEVKWRMSPGNETVGRIISEFSVIRNEANNNYVTTVLIDRNFLKKYVPKARLTSGLPFTTENKGIIRYTVNVLETDPCELHNKMKIDYILSADSVHKKNFLYFRSNDYFTLYKNSAK